MLLCSIRLQEMRTELDETMRAKDQLERVTFQLVDELRQVKGRLDSQTVDVGTVVNDLKNKSKKLEEENKQTVGKFIVSWQMKAGAYPNLDQRITALVHKVLLKDAGHM